MLARLRSVKATQRCLFTGVLLLALVLLWSQGCGRKSGVTAAPPSAKQSRPILYDQELHQLLIYYATSDSRYLVPVTATVNPTREVAKTAVEKLLAGPPGEGLLRTVPEGVKLREIYSFPDEKIAYVDLTKEFLQMKGPAEADMAVRSLTLTLTELKDIEGVRLLVDGKNLTELAGLKLEETLQRPAAINSLQGEAGKKATVQVYFGDRNCLYLVPVTLAVQETELKDLPRAALLALLAGPPKDSGLFPTVWPGTKLRSLHIQDGVAFVDLSKEAVAYGGGSAAETLFVNSLLWTLTQFGSIDKVQLLFEGQKKDYLPEGTAVKEPLARPNKLNAVPM